MLWVMYVCMCVNEKNTCKGVVISHKSSSKQHNKRVIVQIFVRARPPFLNKRKLPPFCIRSRCASIFIFGTIPNKEENPPRPHKMAAVCYYF